MIFEDFIVNLQLKLLTRIFILSLRKEMYIEKNGYTGTSLYKTNFSKNDIDLLPQLIE